MKKIFKPFIFGLLTLVASVGVYFNYSHTLSFNSDNNFIVTEKEEQHTHLITATTLTQALITTVLILLH